MEAHISVNSIRTTYMDKVSINGEKIDNTVANGKITRWKDLEP